MAAKDTMKMKTGTILHQPKAFYPKNKIAKIEANKSFSQQTCFLDVFQISFKGESIATLSKVTSTRLFVIWDSHNCSILNDKQTSHINF